MESTDRDTQTVEVQATLYFTPAIFNATIRNSINLPEYINPGPFLMKTTAIVVLLRPRSTRDEIFFSLCEIFEENPGRGTVDFVLRYLVGTGAFNTNLNGQYTFTPTERFNITAVELLILKEVILWKRTTGIRAHRDAPERLAD
uniref:Uncharacterized protein n=1 Tax=Steinernema glaseri TaxID=37863 RepID=A0A1I7Y128_9BILA